MDYIVKQCVYYLQFFQCPNEIQIKQYSARLHYRNVFFCNHIFIKALNNYSCSMFSGQLHHAHVQRTRILFPDTPLLPYSLFVTCYRWFGRILWGAFRCEHEWASKMNPAQPFVHSIVVLDRESNATNCQKKPWRGCSFESKSIHCWYNTHPLISLASTCAYNMVHMLGLRYSCTCKYQFDFLLLLTLHLNHTFASWLYVCLTMVGVCLVFTKRFWTFLCVRVCKCELYIKFWASFWIPDCDEWMPNARSVWSVLQIVICQVLSLLIYFRYSFGSK